MTILTRLGALGALSVLAACGSTSETVSTDVSEVLAAASTFTPTYDDGATTASEAAASEDGLQGFVGLEDGTIVPVSIKIDELAGTLTVTVGDNEPIVYTDDEGTWMGSGGSISFWEGDETLELRDWANNFYVDVSLLTAPEDLPTSGEVGYSGYFDMEGETSGSYGSLSVAVNFADGSVEGAILGGLYDEGFDEECCIRIPEISLEDPAPEGDAYFGSLEGTVEGSLLAASGDVSGTVSGSVAILGGFFENGNQIEGGIAGTIDDQTMGGDFELWTGGGGPI